jgi:tetratricopeptide (TPR) repeat protein
MHLTGVQVFCQRAGGASEELRLVGAAADFVRPLEVGECAPADGPWGVLDDSRATHWDIWPEINKPHSLVLLLAAPCEIGEEDELVVRLECLCPRHPQAKLGRFRISACEEGRVVPDQLFLTAIRGEALLERNALAAAHLARGEATEALELLSRPPVDPGRDEAARLLLLADAQAMLGRTDEAQAAWNQFAGAPQSPQFLRPLQPLFVRLAVEAGGLDRAEADRRLGRSLDLELATLSKAIQAAPSNAAAHWARAVRLARFGSWKESAKDGARFVELYPNGFSSRFVAAPVMLLADDKDGWRAACRWMIANCRPGEIQPADFTCKIALLLPEEFDVKTLPIKTVQDASLKASVWRGFYLFNCALIAYRQDDWEGAIKISQEAPAVLLKDQPLDQAAPVIAAGRLVQAMSEHRLGRTEEAIRLLSEAHKLVPSELQNLGTPEYAGSLPVSSSVVSGDWLITEILRREAASLIMAD